MNKQLATERLKQICSKYEKCSKDIYDKLKSWEYEGSYTEIIEELKKENYLNEGRYTKSYINDKIKFSKWGKNKIRFILSGKGIPEEFISEGLSKFDAETYRSIIIEEIQKKSKTIKGNDTYKKKQKLFSFAYGRGYEQDIFQSIIDKLLD